ncbi:unnamed protein product, partial [Onchocerca ochengi]|uniref:Uncharacterized protein n=1 Tax=Onchocerca ochengi TaxID=42157 RepID=A0A182EYS6_ONCOC
MLSTLAPTIDTDGNSNFLITYTYENVIENGTDFDGFKESSLFLMFGGSNVEASTVLVETTNEEKLREKLLKWK